MMWTDWWTYVQPALVACVLSNWNSSSHPVVPFGPFGGFRPLVLCEDSDVVAESRPTKSSEPPAESLSSSASQLAGACSKSLLPLVRCDELGGYRVLTCQPGFLKDAPASALIISIHQTPVS
ncbi:hypothetical protein BV22DRAFT_95126 [Leucogyrophana mollusca]|uniref:Uncharacterized protein n=1 Tax=Leucogyrophana mollusca TaxID=85980 RepID=A0ACB8BWZ8_9AGAM|nr:hypothetical protein BV22DRAFT_95126 [Leucogyrophana mollusca]